MTTSPGRGRGRAHGAAAAAALGGPPGGESGTDGRGRNARRRGGASPLPGPLPRRRDRPAGYDRGGDDARSGGVAAALAPPGRARVPPGHRRGAANRGRGVGRCAAASRRPCCSRAAMLAVVLLLGMANLGMDGSATASGLGGRGPKRKGNNRRQQLQLSEDRKGLGLQTEEAENEIAYDSGGARVDEEGGEDAASGPPVEAPAATILSRASQLSSLISNLDASDVVECYVVTRMAPLADVASQFGGNNNDGRRNGDSSRRVHRMLSDSMAANAGAAADPAAPSKTSDGASPASPASSSAANGIPSGPVVVRKSALAFRYRGAHAASDAGADGGGNAAGALPSPDDRGARPRPKYFELTLEYGPQRAGAARTAESLPMVRWDGTALGGAGDGGGDPYVAWENEGRVYHATRISGEWTEAYYMAALTGVVFERILGAAVEYARDRPRYQPFEVVALPSGDRLLPSTGADDFVWGMVRTLVDLYVEVDPVLVPPRGRVQFYVADPPEGDVGGAANAGGARRPPNPHVRRVKGPAAARRAAAFYESFFRCAGAILTGDYSAYKSAAPTAALVVAPSASPSAAPVAAGEPAIAAAVKANETAPTGPWKEESSSGKEGDRHREDDEDVGEATPAAGLWEEESSAGREGDWHREEGGNVAAGLSPPISGDVDEGDTTALPNGIDDGKNHTVKGMEGEGDGGMFQPEGGKDESAPRSDINRKGDVDGALSPPTSGEVDEGDTAALAKGTDYGKNNTVKGIEREGDGGMIKPEEGKDGSPPTSDIYGEGDAVGGALSPSTSSAIDEGDAALESGDGYGENYTTKGIEGKGNGGMFEPEEGKDESLPISGAINEGTANISENDPEEDEEGSPPMPSTIDEGGAMISESDNVADHGPRNHDNYDRNHTIQALDGDDPLHEKLNGTDSSRKPHFRLPIPPRNRRRLNNKQLNSAAKVTPSIAPEMTGPENLSTKDQHNDNDIFVDEENDDVDYLPPGLGVDDAWSTDPAFDGTEDGSVSADDPAEAAIKAAEAAENAGECVPTTGGWPCSSSALRVRAHSPRSLSWQLF